MNALVLTGLVGAGLVAIAAGSGARPTRSARVGKHWTWQELTVSSAASRLGLDNTPSTQARRNLEWMVRHVLDPLRERYGHDAVQVNSAYRRPAVNRAVGGVASSRHLVGLAVDLAGACLRDPTLVGALRQAGLRVLVYPTHLHIEVARRSP